MVLFLVSIAAFRCPIRFHRKLRFPGWSPKLVNPIPDAPSTEQLYCEDYGLYVKGKGKGIEINNMLGYTG